MYVRMYCVHCWPVAKTSTCEYDINFVCVGVCVHFGGPARALAPVPFLFLCACNTTTEYKHWLVNKTYLILATLLPVTENQNQEF